MFKLRLLALATASLVFVPPSFAANYAAAVAGYDSGAGFANGYTNPTQSLGEPSRVTSGQFGGPVEPFNPAYLNSQLVSVGAGGFLTVQFATPVLNNPANPFGLDFIVFGGAGFIITNEFSLETFEFIGTPATDGSLFAHNTGATRVDVSADGVTFYELNPSLAPTVDGFSPTDGSGDFQKPLNPAFNGGSFAGQTLAGIRALYDGSGGGAGFDIAWARDGDGQSVALPGISFVRVRVLSDKSEIDGFAAVPEPATWTLLALGAGMLGLARRRRTR